MSDPNWSSLNWTALTALLVAIGSLSSPFFVGLWNSRVKGLETSALTAESAAARLERLAREHLDRIEAARERAEKRVEDAETETEDVRAQGRGMDEWAHYYRHGWVNIAQRFRSLFLLFEQHVAGTLATERAMAILAEIKPSLPEPPPSVPMLRDAATVSPPR